MELVLLC